MEEKTISITQLWNDFKQLPKNTNLKFIFEDGNISKRKFLRVETKNIVTLREKDNRSVWMGKPKKENQILKKDNLYTMKNYTYDSKDLKIEVIF